MFEDGADLNDEQPSCPSDKTNKKVNHQEKNLEHIERLKEKRQRELQEKEREERKEQALRDRLKRKVLDEAVRLREAKEKENRDNVKDPSMVESVPKREKRHQVESLPKVFPAAESKEQSQKYKNRYLSFLSNLSDGIKHKKQSEQIERKRKEEQYAKLREELGVNKVESKLGKLLQKKPVLLARSHSAEKFDELHAVEEESSKNITSNKNFRDKNTEYIEKIKQRREKEQQEKEEQERRKEKMKEKLRMYVMTTVKNNVLEGVYDDELDKKKSTKREEDEAEEQESSESEHQQPQQPVEKKKRKKMRDFPYITDLAEWKKKNRISSETKVFIVTGGYVDVKKALRARGWVENPNYGSPCFELKWTLQGREIDYGNLYDWQLVNHFEKNGSITTKVGLCRSLRNMHWVCNVDADDFYPKCFDLNDEDDYAHFQQYFKISKATSVLKLFMKLFGLRNIEELEKLRPRAKVALEVCQRNILDIDEIIDRKKTLTIITAKEWEVLAQDELNAEDLAKKKHEQWLYSIDAKYNERPAKKARKKKQQNQQQPEPNEDLESADDFTKSVSALLQEYERRFPQFTLSDIHNIWILKPAGLSRGRGITCYNNFVEIRDHIKSKESLWVAQKYIENPLIVCRRKFDIRQWVLVTDFNPLIVWFYEECYIRFSVLDYNAEDVNNKFVHLTNNAIASLHKDFDNSEIKGSMFSMEQFRQHLLDKEGYDVFTEVLRGLRQKIQPQMKDIVKWSLQSAQEHIENRKNSHEMFGYDFMIDDNYKVWLIEINSSPSMDYSTHITERLVKQGLEDTVKVIVDYYSAPKKLRKTIDTGGYKLLFKGTEIPDKPITTGLNLGIEGVPLKKGKRSIVKPKVFNPMETGDSSVKNSKPKDQPKESTVQNPKQTSSTAKNQPEQPPEPWNGQEEQVDCEDHQPNAASEPTS